MKDVVWLDQLRADALNRHTGVVPKPPYWGQMDAAKALREAEEAVMPGVTEAILAHANSSSGQPTVTAPQDRPIFLITARNEVLVVSNEGESGEMCRVTPFHLWATSR